MKFRKRHKNLLRERDLKILVRSLSVKSETKNRRKLDRKNAMTDLRFEGLSHPTIIHLQSFSCLIFRINFPNKNFDKKRLDIRILYVYIFSKDKKMHSPLSVSETKSQDPCHQDSKAEHQMLSENPDCTCHTGTCTCQNQPIDSN